MWRVRPVESLRCRDRLPAAGIDRGRAGPGRATQVAEPDKAYSAGGSAGSSESVRARRDDGHQVYLTLGSRTAYPTSASRFAAIIANVAMRVNMSNT
jgi:hypothetical protein